MLVLLCVVPPRNASLGKRDKTKNKKVIKERQNSPIGSLTWLALTPILEYIMHGVNKHICTCTNMYMWAWHLLAQGSGV